MEVSAFYVFYVSSNMIKLKRLLRNCIVDVDSCLFLCK